MNGCRKGQRAKDQREEHARNRPPEGEREGSGTLSDVLRPRHPIPVTKGVGHATWIRKPAGGRSSRRLHRRHRSCHRRSLWHGGLLRHRGLLMHRGLLRHLHRGSRSGTRSRTEACERIGLATALVSVPAGRPSGHTRKRADVRVISGSCWLSAALSPRADRLAVPTIEDEDNSQEDHYNRDDQDLGGLGGARQCDHGVLRKAHVRKNTASRSRNRGWSGARGTIYRQPRPPVMSSHEVLGLRVMTYEGVGRLLGVELEPFTHRHPDPLAA